MPKYRYEVRSATHQTRGRSGRRITSITIHHWGADGQTHDGVVKFLCSYRPTKPSSAHDVVSAGRVTNIVPAGNTAYHAGVWARNLDSYGIECRPEATDEDYLTVAQRIIDVRKQEGWKIPLRKHSDWKPTACPGRWDLNRLERLATKLSAPAPTLPKDDDEMGFYVYADMAKDGVYWFNQATGKITRHIPSAEWSALRAMEGGALPPLTLPLHKVSTYWLDRMKKF